MEYLKDMYLMPFRVISAGMKIFIRNRNRVRDFIRQPGIAKTLKYGMMLTLLVWLAIALLSKDEENNRLTDAVNNLWSKTTDDISKTNSTSVNEQPE
jgi:hypothetical protein